MAKDEEGLVRQLRQAGISLAAIRAAWPSWWTSDAGASPSGRAELRFALARRLGLEPKPLLGERVEFIWNDEARFKHLSNEDFGTRGALASFGISVGRLLLRATQPGPELAGVSAETLRAAIRGRGGFVDLQTLISGCWAFGVPVLHLRVFPLESKSMHAMVVTVAGRYAILLGRDASYPAPVAFTLAHEIGHIALGHLIGAQALVDLLDPATAAEPDDQERQADSYALTLLTGSPDPDIRTNLDRFNGRSLADAVLKAAHEYGVEPGALALCVGFRRNAWAAANAALGHIYNVSKPVWREVNGILDSQLDWGSLGDDGAHYLRNLMAGRDD